MAAFTPIASSIAPSEDMDATDDEQAQAGQHGKGPSPIGGGGGHKAGHDENAKKKTGTSAKKRTTLPVRELKDFFISSRGDEATPVGLEVMQSGRRDLVATGTAHIFVGDNLQGLLSGQLDSEASGVRLDVLDWCISYDPTGPMVWVVAESGWYRLTTPRDEYSATFGSLTCRVVLSVRSEAALLNDSALTYRSGLKTVSAPIPGLALPPPPATGSVFLAPLEGDARPSAEELEDDGIRTALTEGAPRRLKELEVLREADFVCAQMHALVSVGALPEPKRPSPAEDDLPPGDGRFLATLTRRRTAMLASEKAPPPPPTRRPPPQLPNTTAFLTPQRDIPQLLMAWDFCQVYALLLRLPPCPLSRFEAAYAATLPARAGPHHTPVPGDDPAPHPASTHAEIDLASLALMRDVHTALLRLLEGSDVGLRPQPAEAVAPGDPGQPLPELLAEASWAKRLLHCLETPAIASSFVMTEEVRQATAQLHKSDWWRLPTSSRLAITNALVAAVLDLEPVRTHINLRLDAVLQADKVGKIPVSPGPEAAQAAPAGGGAMAAAEALAEKARELAEAAQAAAAGPDIQAAAAAAAEASRAADEAARAQQQALIAVAESGWDDQAPDRCVFRHGAPVCVDASGRRYFEFGGSAGRGLLFVADFPAAPDAPGEGPAEAAWGVYYQGSAGGETRELREWLGASPWGAEQRLADYLDHLARGAPQRGGARAALAAGADGYARLAGDGETASLRAQSAPFALARLCALRVLAACRFWNLSQRGVAAWLAAHQEISAATATKQVAATLLRLEELAVESQSVSDKWASKHSESWRSSAVALCHSPADLGNALSWLFSLFSPAPATLPRADFLEVARSVSPLAVVPDVGDDVAIVTSGLRAVWNAAFSFSAWPMPQLPIVQRATVLAAQYASEAVGGPWGVYCAAWFLVKPSPAADARGLTVGQDLPPLAVPLLVLTPPADPAAEYLVPWAHFLKGTARPFKIDDPIKMLFTEDGASKYYVGHVTDVKRADPWESVQVRWLNEDAWGSSPTMWVSPWELELAPEVGPPPERPDDPDAAARTEARRAANQDKLLVLPLDAYPEEYEEAARAVGAEFRAAAAAGPGGAKGGFWAALDAFCGPRGGRPKAPVFAKEELDLERVFLEVAALGGYDAVIAARSWKGVARSLGRDVGAQASAASAMRSAYERSLLAFERSAVARKLVLPEPFPEGEDPVALVAAACRAVEAAQRAAAEAEAMGAGAGAAGPAAGAELDAGAGGRDRGGERGRERAERSARKRGRDEDEGGRPSRRARKTTYRDAGSSEEEGGSSDGGAGGDSDDSGDFLSGRGGRRASLRAGGDRDRHHHPQRASARAAAAQRVSYVEDEEDDDE